MKKSNLLNLSILFTIFLIGSLLRLYNINFDDFWYDEILSFTAANPNLSVSENFRIQTEIDNTPFLGSFLLRFFFKIFEYHPDTARYFPSFFSIASILSIAYLARTLKNNRSYLLVAFLISSNIFLISYSQELRNYSILFFLSSLSYIFFIKILENEKQIFTLILFIFFSFLQVLSHPISFIVIISYILYAVLNFVIFRKINFNLNLGIIISCILCLIYFAFYFANYTIHSWEWISQPNFKFFTNFYFSNFFGSRLMGLIFLLLLIFLLFKNRKLFENLDKITIFFIIIILSYLLPISFGYIYKPILVSRYIIYVIAPIIILISYLIFELKNKIIKNTLICILCLSTVGNLFTEQTVKQFFQDRIVHKPEFKKAIKIIETSDTNKYYFKIASYPEKAPAPGSPETIVTLQKYFSLLNKKSNKKIVYSNLKSKKIWIVCLTDLHGFDCSLPEKIKSKKVLQDINLNRLNLKLIEL